MRVLFLGGTGNLSTDCARWLYQQGHKILVVSRGKSSVPPEYTTIICDRKDLTRELVLRQAPDVAVDFIAYEPAEVRQDFELFRDAVRQFIFVSSATVYAKPPVRLPITEDAPLGNAYWEYARKKLTCEQWLRERWREDRFPVTIIRPSHTYSQRWIPNPVSSGSYTFAARLEQGLPVFVPDNGENPWTLTAASDFAVGFGGLVGNERAVGEAIHITSDEALTWNQIYAEIAAALGVAAPDIVQVPTEFICEIAPDLVGNLKGDKSHPGVFDNAKVKRLVPGFVCRKPFREGVRESVAWLRAHPEQQNHKPELDRMIESVVTGWRSRPAMA
jgi:nucleoside-diphosphate-sugar epimerase